MTCAQLRTKTQISISKNMLCKSRDFKFFMQYNSLVHSFQGNFRLCNRIEFKLFFVNDGNS